MNSINVYCKLSFYLLKFLWCIGCSVFEFTPIPSCLHNHLKASFSPSFSQQLYLTGLSYFAFEYFDRLIITSFNSDLSFEKYMYAQVVLSPTIRSQCFLQPILAVEGGLILMSSLLPLTVECVTVILFTTTFFTFTKAQSLKG